MYDDDWREPARAKRIRDRDRMRARGFAHASHLFSATDRPGTAGYAWRDRDGKVRVGLRTDDDLRERRWLYAVASEDVRCRCSGPCCGNPRRNWNAASLQESRAEQDAIDQFREADLPSPPPRFRCVGV